jgi:2'-5' RNA ligase
VDTAAPRRPRLLGVAVELPEPYASVLAEVRRESGDPAADHMAPHITLVPPVLVTAGDAELDEVLRAGAARVARFDVHLRGTGTFRPVSEVVFVTVAAGIGSLEQLSVALRVHPLDPPRRFPYHPHVTVAMAGPTAALDEVYGRLSGFQARFEVASFRLYEHDAHEPADGGRRWHPVRDVALTGRAGD